MSDSISILNIEIDTTNLHFVNLPTPDSIFYKIARIECKIDLYDSLDKILKSSIFKISIADTISRWDTTIKLQINHPFKGYCRLFIKSVDFGKNYTVKYLNIDKTSPYSAQWFYTNLQDKHFLKISDTFKIYNSAFDIDSLVFSVYKFPPVAAPPFVTELNLKDIEIEKIKDHSISASQSWVATSDLLNTLINVSIDTFSTGIFFIVVPAHFPEIIYPYELVPPLRYITTDTEFNSMLKSEYPKKTVDSFWLAQIGEAKRAAEVIKKYYTRVTDADKWFTDIQPGWQTDKGLIYIVQGPPNYIYRLYDTEIWLYGSKDEMYAKSYYFYRTYIPNTKMYTWKLYRNNEYKPFWFYNVNLWRK